jgi:CubicO group peptidase (beta-lactamase class C family)
MLFRLGSTTKMFTAIALVNLAAQGRIKLDEPIGTYAKGLHRSLARITTHQLISNTGGMADIEAPVSQDDEALAKMARSWNDSVRFAEPGQIYSYSSAGFWLSGFLIEEITKKPYADAMAELVFQPLGMDRTTLRPLVAITYPLAMGHSASGKEPAKIIRPAYNNVAQWPAGSIYSNIGELSRFVIAMLNGGKLEGKQAIPADVVAKMHGKYTPMPGDPDAGYGYGLLNFPYRGVRVLMHGGFSRGYGSMIQMMPEQKWAVIVVSNRSGETMPRSRNKAIEMFLKLNPETPEPAKAALPMNSEDMTRFAGKYVNGTQTWEIVIKDGKLVYKQPDGDQALTKTAANRLSFGSSLENDLMFVPNQSGEMEYVFDGLYSARKAR